ncbi:MAG: peptidoglycan-binding protein [Aureispira sp.]|nr:peptidoglycan-binding protein [Aureispira sp.]
MKKEELKQVAKLKELTKQWILLSKKSDSKTESIAQNHQKMMNIHVLSKKIEDIHANGDSPSEFKREQGGAPPVEKGKKEPKHISDRVGYYGKNREEDVLIIQKLLNQYKGYEVPEDGKYSKELELTIRKFQIDRTGIAPEGADATVDPNGFTWKALVSGKVHPPGIIKPMSKPKVEAKAGISKKEAEILNNFDKVELNVASVEFEKVFKKELNARLTYGDAYFESSAVTDNKAYFKATSEFDSLLTGIKLMVEAGIISENTLELKAGYKNKYAHVEAKLALVAKVQAKFKTNLTLFDLSTMTLVDFNAHAIAEAKLEATAKLNAEFNLWAGLKMHQSISVSARLAAKAEAEAALTVSADKVKVGAKFNLMAKAAVEGASHFDVTNSDGEQLFAIDAKLEASAGIGLKGGGMFEWERGKIKVHVDLGAALLLGAGGELDVMVDVEEITEEIYGQIEQYIVDSDDSPEEIRKKITNLLISTNPALATASTVTGWVGSGLEEIGSWFGW